MRARTPQSSRVTAGLNTALLVSAVVGYGFVVSVADIKRADRFFIALRTLTFVVPAISVVGYCDQSSPAVQAACRGRGAGQFARLDSMPPSWLPSWVGWVIPDVDVTTLVDLFYYALIALMFIVPAITVSVVALQWSEQD